MDERKAAGNLINAPSRRVERRVGRLNAGVSSSHLTLPLGGQRDYLSEGKGDDQKSLS